VGKNLSPHLKARQAELEGVPVTAPDNHPVLALVGAVGPDAGTRHVEHHRADLSNRLMYQWCNPCVLSLHWR
jgi:hypothetical protein